MPVSVRSTTELENEIRREITQSLRGNKVPKDPGDVADSAFRVLATSVKLLYGNSNDEVARRNFHRHWIYALGRMYSRGELRITAGCQLVA